MNYYGILINPVESKVERVEFDNRIVGLKELYDRLQCEVVERVPIASGEDFSVDLWLDEEGMLNGASERIGQFQINDYMFAGYGLIILSDLEGESIGFPESMEDILSMVAEAIGDDNDFNLE